MSGSGKYSSALQKRVNPARNRSQEETTIYFGPGHLPRTHLCALGMLARSLLLPTVTRKKRGRHRKNHERNQRNQEAGAHLFSVGFRGGRVAVGHRDVQPAAPGRGGATPPACLGEVAGRGGPGLRGQPETGVVSDAAAQSGIAVALDRRDAGGDDGPGEGELRRG